MAEQLRRGEVRWVTFEPPDKRRPAIIITRPSALGYLSGIIVAPISTTIRDAPTQVRLGSEDGLPQECVVNLDEVSSIRRERIGPLIILLSDAKLAAVERALLFAVGMERYRRA